jgi:hypothetical protein
MTWMIWITTSFAQPCASGISTCTSKDSVVSISLVEDEIATESGDIINATLSPMSYEVIAQVDPTSNTSIDIFDAQPFGVESDMLDSAEEDAEEVPAYQWQNLRLPATPVVSTDFRESLFLIDTQSRIWELRTTGRWQISLDMSEQSQIDQEDLLLDAQSSFEEFLEQEDLDSISEDDLLEDNDDEMQTVVQSIEDELESAIFDPLRQSKVTISTPFIGGYSYEDFNEEMLYACVDGRCFQYNRKNWSEIDIPHIYDLESRIVDGEIEVFALTEDGMYYQKANSKWKKIPTAPICSEIEQKRIWDGEAQISSVFFAHCNSAIFISMDGKYWARKSEISGRDLVFADTINFPDSLFMIHEKETYVSKDLGQTFSKLRYETTSNDILVHKIFPIQQRIQDSDRFNFFLDHDVIGLGTNIYGIRSLQISNIVSPINFVQDPYFYFGSMNGFLTLVGSSGVYQYLPKVDMKQNIQDMNVLNLESSLEMSTRELRMQLEMTQLQNSFLRALQLPVLALEVGRDNNRTIGADYGAISSFAQENDAWSVSLDLCFGGCGNSVGTDMSGFTEELIVVDGQIYPGTEIGMTPAVSGLSASLNKDIRSKSNQVTDIYDSLQRVMQYEQVGNISLYESVQRELERQELIAFLQYLTNSNFFISEE